jgi:hypothetical protein
MTISGLTTQALLRGNTRTLSRHIENVCQAGLPDTPSKMVAF